MEQETSHNITNFKDAFNLSHGHLKTLLNFCRHQEVFNPDDPKENWPAPIRQAVDYVENLQKSVEEAQKFHCLSCNTTGLAKDLVVTHPEGEPHANDFHCPNCNSEDIEIIDETTDPELMNLYQCRTALHDLVRLKQSKQKLLEEYETSKETMWDNAARLILEASDIPDTK